LGGRFEDFFDAAGDDELRLLHLDSGHSGLEVFCE
jgi:hypothetical protein